MQFDDDIEQLKTLALKALETERQINNLHTADWQPDPTETTQRAEFQCKATPEMILKLITLLYEALDLLYYRTADNTSTKSEADPATVLAMVEEIERLRAGLKPACPHWQQDGDGINEWRRCCTNRSYTIPEGGEPSEFCPDCGGRVTVFVPIEILDTDPNAESDE